MHKLLKYYRLANVLSLDVAVGAVVSALFFCKVFEVQILPSGIISLGAAVWIIYTADHLLDTFGIQHQASTVRHRFHQQNKKILSGVLVFVLAISSSQIFFVRKPVLIGGIVLSGIIGIYFLFQKRLKYLKELVGACLYTGGVLLVPLSLRLEYLNIPNVILIVQFLITALLNLLLFSWFDYKQDSIDYRESFATIFGLDQTKKIVSILFLVNGAMSIYMLVLYSTFSFASITILVMNLILILLYAKMDYFSVDDRYRIVGDAVFMIPLFYIFFNS